MKKIPIELFIVLKSIASKLDIDIYLSGGVPRDWLLGRSFADYDFTASSMGVDVGRILAASLNATFVLLDKEEGICRVVFHGIVADISTFRKDASTIVEDLGYRDFTINAMAFDVLRGLSNTGELSGIIDPLGGEKDLRDGIIRVCYSQSFTDDPLRILRAFRFMAQFGFTIDGHTAALIRNCTKYIETVSAERIWSELTKILEQDQSWEIFELMGRCDVLGELFPELNAGKGMQQPSSHHLDVFGHSLETLKQMESLVEKSSIHFPDNKPQIEAYCSNPDNVLILKIAALLHDVGKPVSVDVKDSGRIIFYNHDGKGEELIHKIADRLKWSANHKQRVSRLVKQHMWPFHLNNARKKTGITARACLKLAKAAGDDLVGLFLLAMADSLAGQGEGKPVGMEEEITVLFSEVYSTYVLKIEPVLVALPINGHDLKRILHLEPGPLFGVIFSELEKELVSGESMDKNQALAWVEDFLASK